MHGMHASHLRPRERDAPADLNRRRELPGARLNHLLGLDKVLDAAAGVGAAAPVARAAPPHGAPRDDGDCDGVLLDARTKGGVFDLLDKSENGRHDIPVRLRICRSAAITWRPYDTISI